MMAQRKSNAGLFFVRTGDSDRRYGSKPYSIFGSSGNKGKYARSAGQSAFKRDRQSPHRVRKSNKGKQGKH